MIVHTDTRPISTRVIVFTISLFIFTSCLSEYSDHFDAEHSNSPALAEAYHTSTDTDKVWILPDIKIKQELIHSLQAAENRIWLEIYMITDTDVVSELVAAYERGVDVRVILEGNVYGLPYANTRVLNILKDA